MKRKKGGQAKKEKYIKRKKKRGNHIMVVSCVCITVVRVRFPISPNFLIKSNSFDSSSG